MTKQKPHVPTPCHEPWSGMNGDARKRLCAACDTHVHNLSEMNQDEALSLLDSTPGVCVMYAMDQQGEALFRDSDDSQWRLNLQLKGAQRLVQAAALALPMMFAGCQPPQQPAQPEVEVVAPLVVEEGKDVKVGASTTPPVLKPELTPTPRHMMGKFIKKPKNPRPIKAVHQKPLRKVGLNVAPVAPIRPHVVGLHVAPQPPKRIKRPAPKKTLTPTPDPESGK